MENLLKVACMSVVILLYLLNSYTECCNESVCGSIVSKCLLMQLCRCTPGNYTCNKECYYCLKDSYSECCSCVELCEIPDPYHTETIDSYIGVIDNSVPGLFQALSEEETDWTSETFQIQYHVNHKESPKMSSFPMDNDMNEILRNEEMECTVVFLKNCTSVSKCEKICASMGASGFRWFHDGCCECVGEKCFNFGLKESKCRFCSYGDEIDWESSEDIYHFSEDNDLGDANDIVDMIW
ncbi:twisted gastrulation protein homolog 1-A-like [Coccinella septempunctata]|uniref:twisted gastrulation protein homolog 1-A-like n=1 Tax=Coccinella septempunctata TaxID=41139 RepID=UPI001D0780A6|nr:twisted gastrulation protein homolog 1-A-like [Coccinella septempunctata]